MTLMTDSGQQIVQQNVWIAKVINRKIVNL